jgi:hypothetical protein
MRMNVRTNLLLRKDLVDEVDRLAGHRGRSRYVNEALEQKLRADRLRLVVRGTAGAWRDNPLFPTNDSVTEWVRARRAEETRDDQ